MAVFLLHLELVNIFEYIDFVAEDCLKSLLSIRNIIIENIIAISILKNHRIGNGEVTVK